MKKASKTLRTLLLVLLISVSLLGTAFASETYTYRWSEGDTDYTAKMTTTMVTAKQYPIYSSQARHVQGVVTTIGVSTTQTTTCLASSSLTVEFSSAFFALSAEASVSQSQSYSVTVSITYSIPESVAGGRYRITTIYPAKQVHETVTSAGPDSLVLQEMNRTITYAPETNAAYRALERYGD